MLIPQSRGNPWNHKDAGKANHKLKNLKMEPITGMNASFHTYLQNAVQHMERHAHIRFEPGMDNDEIALAEEHGAFIFPPDLRAFLQTALPVRSENALVNNHRRIHKHYFPNWRDLSQNPMRSGFKWIMKGVYFDIFYNKFWHTDWGRIPEKPLDQFRAARQVIQRAPRLIPIYGHRFVVGEPNRVGNPVLSVWQLDIIYYGNDLADYLFREFGVPKPVWAAEKPRCVPFWSSIIDSDFTPEYTEPCTDNGKGKLLRLDE